MGDNGQGLLRTGSVLTPSKHKYLPPPTSLSQIPLDARCIFTTTKKTYVLTAQLPLPPLEEEVGWWGGSRILGIARRRLAGSLCKPVWDLKTLFPERDRCEDAWPSYTRFHK